MNKKRKIITNFLEVLGLKEKRETPLISDIRKEYEQCLIYLTYIIDNNLLGQQVKTEELAKQLIIAPIKNR